MPHSVVLLDVDNDKVTAHLELPIADLSLAMGIDLRNDPEGTVAQQQGAMINYLSAHFAPMTLDGRAWIVEFRPATVTAAEQTSTGRYQEVQVDAVLTPPAGGDTRHFHLGYDAVVHQVVTHTALISVSQDWKSGSAGETAPSEVGVVRIDTATGRVLPVTIDLGAGSTWRGFIAMVELGMSHIREGTDHLLFLLTLLLPAPLVVSGRRWGGFSGVRASTSSIAKITLAFTIGHSATLIVASLGHWAPWTGTVEALIAVSIAISAAHAIRPIFVGKEVFVAGFFGLIHGAAFSVVLAELNLGTTQMLLSLLGFNLGIELMQVAIVAVVLPSLIVLASTRAYTPVRVCGAVVAGVAALGWLFDRLGTPNTVAVQADRLGAAGPWVIGALAITAMVNAAGRRRLQQSVSADVSTQVEA